MGAEIRRFLVATFCVDEEDFTGAFSGFAAVEDLGLDFPLAGFLFVAPPDFFEDMEDRFTDFESYVISEMGSESSFYFLRKVLRLSFANINPNGTSKSLTFC